MFINHALFIFRTSARMMSFWMWTHSIQLHPTPYDKNCMVWHQHDFPSNLSHSTVFILLFGSCVTGLNEYIFRITIQIIIAPCKHIEWISSFNQSAFSASNAMKHYIEILDWHTIPYSSDWSKDILIVHVDKDSSKRYPVFYALGLQTPTLNKQGGILYHYQSFLLKRHFKEMRHRGSFFTDKRCKILYT